MFAAVSVLIVLCNLFTGINHKVCGIFILTALFLQRISVNYLTL